MNLDSLSKAFGVRLSERAVIAVEKQRDACDDDELEHPKGCVCEDCEPGDAGYPPLPRDTIPDADEKAPVVIDPSDHFDGPFEFRLTVTTTAELLERAMDLGAEVSGDF